MRILVVCAGNICRSPLAEELLRRALSARGVEAEVTSAGLWAEPGLPASEGLEAPARLRGVDLSRHRARQLEASHLSDADLVLVMTAAQLDDIAGLAPQGSATVTVLLLGEADIDDPYMGNAATYEACAAEIEAGVEVFADRVASGRV
ncbi:MAG TPA: low molecular weight phosphotyrosine protein phosphatase [Actinomycetota bacterium]|nr:low molecular weight phosphotyrosine protein phosphatase [Actinomycetota bacterium]